MFRASLALRPAGREGLAAVLTEDKAAQGKVCAYVLPGGSLRSLGKALLNPLVRLEIDQALVVALPKRDTPARGLDISGIDNTGEDVEHPLVADFTARKVLGKGGLAFEEALDLHLSGEAS
jgi:hypothetical protein